MGTGVGELDLVLGGGLVPGSAILVGGEPGAGKSTLLLQTLCLLAETQSALYVTGEESPQQVAMRAKRLQLPTEKLEIMAETSVETVCAIAEQKKPKILVVDSDSGDAYGRDCLSARQCFPSARECCYVATLCQTDRYCTDYCGACY